MSPLSSIQAYIELVRYQPVTPGRGNIVTHCLTPDKLSSRASLDARIFWRRSYPVKFIIVSDNKPDDDYLFVIIKKFYAFQSNLSAWLGQVTKKKLHH